MTNDEILQAAKVAGIEFKPLPRDLYCEAWLEQLEHLAAIIEKRTIERCESLLMLLHEKHKHNHNHFHYASIQVAAIRKLGEQE